MIARRSFCAGVGALALAFPTSTNAAGSSARLEARLQLWQQHCTGAGHVYARVRAVRRSALLRSPLQRDCELVFQQPEQLLLRDEQALTILEPKDARVLRPLAEGGSELQWSRDQLDAQRWLGARMLAMFSGDVETLLAGTRASAPGDRKQQIELAPLRDSHVRRTFRCVTMTLGPRGAVVSIAIEEAQGDELELTVIERRENLSDGELAATQARLRADYLPSDRA